MKTSIPLILAAALAPARAEVSLTIYNQNFGVVRDVVPLALQPGLNQVRFTGNAFDLVGERKRTEIKVDSGNHWLDESFEIKVRNRKQDESVEIRVVEHLYRWTNWEIRESSHPRLKTDAQTIEFRIPLKPGEEKTITYTVHYSW